MKKKALVKKEAPKKLDMKPKSYADNQKMLRENLMKKRGYC